MTFSDFGSHKNFFFHQTVGFPPIRWLHNDFMYVRFGGIRNTKTWGKSTSSQKEKEQSNIGFLTWITCKNIEQPCDELRFIIYPCSNITQMCCADKALVYGSSSGCLKSLPI